MARRLPTPEVGTPFGLWVVVGAAVAEGREIKIPCRCQCGLEKLVLRTNLAQGITNGCRKCYGERQRSRDLVPGWFWSHIVLNARKRGIELSVTRELAEKLFVQQGQRCALSGQPLVFARVSTGVRSVSTASLDRRDSQQGYTEGNIQWVHKTINLMKNVLSEEEFLMWCSCVYQHRKMDPCT